MPTNSTESRNCESIEVPLDREDIVLLILEANKRLFGKDIFSGVTRLEKIVYLLTKEADFEGIAQYYVFTPHNFGPFSKEIYEAVDFLEGCGLIDIREKSYPSYYAAVGEAILRDEISGSDDDDSDDGGSQTASEKLFSLTKNGRKVAEIMRKQVRSRRPKDIDELDRVMVRYANLPLNQLIRYVYRRYTDMTTNSIHPAAQRLKAE